MPKKFNIWEFVSALIIKCIRFQSIMHTMQWVLFYDRRKNGLFKVVKNIYSYYVSCYSRYFGILINMISILYGQCSYTIYMYWKQCRELNTLPIGIYASTCVEEHAKFVRICFESIRNYRINGSSIKPILNHTRRTYNNW